jgi:uncharacterized membrane protein
VYSVTLWSSCSKLNPGIDNALILDYVDSILPALFQLYFLGRQMHPRKTYGLILGGTVLWCGAIVLAPVLAAWEGVPPWVSSVLYRFFDPICHQIDARSFHLFGLPLAVCSRCSSLYIAFLAGTLLYPLFSDISQPRMPSRLLLFIALAPMVFDAGAGFLGLYESSFLTRSLTGALFGAILPFFIIPAAIEGASQLFSTQLQKGTPDA